MRKALEPIALAFVVLMIIVSAVGLGLLDPLLGSAGTAIRTFLGGSPTACLEGGLPLATWARAICAIASV